MSRLKQLRELIESIDVDALVDELDTGWCLVDALTAKLTVATGTFEAEGRHQFTGAVSMRAWLGAHTPLGHAAGSTAVLARKLRSLPVTAQAWLDGELTGGQVATIGSHVSGEHLELFAEHETELVPALVGCSSKDTNDAMAYWRSTADNLIDKPPREPVGIRLQELPGDEGWKIGGYLSPRDGKLVNDMINLLSRPPDKGDTSTGPQRNAAALAEGAAFVIAHHDTSKMPRNAQGLGLMAWAHHAQDPSHGAMTLDGTPISRRLYEEFACAPEVTRILYSSPSTPVDLGRATRTVPKEMFTAVAARDRGCRYPGCDRPVAWCQAHHVTHWLWDGETNYENLVLLCSRHHHIVHAKGWRLAMTDDHTIIVTTPNGRRLISHPPP